MATPADPEAVLEAFQETQDQVGGAAESNGDAASD
jgi:hypothetical protein